MEMGNQSNTLTDTQTDKMARIEMKKEGGGEEEERRFSSQPLGASESKWQKQ